MLAFEGAQWGSEDVAAQYVMSALIGDSKVLNDGFPGRGIHSRSVKNIVQKHPFVEHAYGINNHFTDSGLFGIGIEGQGSHSADIMNIALEELNRLRSGDVQEEELVRTKNIMKSEILIHLEDSESRL